MRYNRPLIALPLLTIFIIISCNSKKDNTVFPGEKYKPDSQELYDTIVKHDSLFFTAYNTCDLALQANYYDDSIEFYHDKGGLMTSKQQLLEGTKNNICGKVTRELVKGSIEVYPIKDYGAIEMGSHMFHNNREPDAVPHASKFIIFWQHKNNEWKMKRVVSLH